MTAALVLWLLASYVLGSIPTSYLAARYGAGVDLRQVGSRNLGATNLYRVLGWRYAVPVAAFDAAKGAVPVLLFSRWAAVGVWGALALGLAAILGHVFSVFLRFKGGKGVATSAGVVLGLAPLAFLAAGIVWVLVVRVSGYVSLGSILAAFAFPAAVAILYPDRREVLWFGIVLGALIVGFHRANIARLLRGTESRFGRRTPENAETPP
jgi:acyl phosphate:glycerol-3-phosphate acyltransferase